MFCSNWKDKSKKWKKKCFEQQRVTPVITSDHFTDHSPEGEWKFLVCRVESGRNFPTQLRKLEIFTSPEKKSSEWSVTKFLNFFEIWKKSHPLPGLVEFYWGYEWVGKFLPDSIPQTRNSHSPSGGWSLLVSPQSTQICWVDCKLSTTPN